MPRRFRAFAPVLAFPIALLALGSGSPALAQTPATTSTPTTGAQESDKATANSSLATTATAGGAQPDSADGPEVAPGIHLPAKGVAWILDDNQGKIDLLRVRHSIGKYNRHTGDNTARAFAWPFISQATTLDVAHPNADVQVHTASPVFFLRQSARDQEEMEDPARGKGQYSIVRLKTNGEHRVVCRFILSTLSGRPARMPDLVDTKVESLPDASEWMKIQPATPLARGHYAVVYLPGNAEEIDDNVYDFDVAP